MSNLQHRQQKIQEKRKKTPWRDFVMEICSWRNLMFYKGVLGVTKYPQFPWREMNLVCYDKQNNLDCYSLELNSQESFLDQLSYLYHRHGFPLVNHYWLQENAQRWDEVWWAKNVYLSVAVWDTAENVLYTFKWESSVRNIISCINVTQNSENVYNSKTVRSSYNVFFSRFIYNSRDIWFCDNLIWCTDCILCHNIQDQSYCIENKQYSREEYSIMKQEILSQRERFDEYYNSLSNLWNITLCNNVSSWYTLYNCSDVENAYELANFNRARNILYCDWWNDSSDCYDVIDSATDLTHHLYAVMWQAFGDHIYCSGNIVESSYIYYSFMLQNCSYCFWCTQLKNKSYCILNKQYTKEERYEKVDKIFSQMEKDGTLGQFFPATMNPFYFNDTAAYLIDPTFTKEEVTAKGYLRRDEAIKVDIPEWMEIVKTSELGNYEWFDSEWNRIINSDILKKVIQDEEGNVYRIVKMEYDFLMKHGLPLPRKHWLERMKENFRI